MNQNNQITWADVWNRLTENQPWPAKNNKPQPEQQLKTDQTQAQKNDDEDKKGESGEIEKYIKQKTEKSLPQLIQRIPNLKQTPLSWPASIQAMKHNRSNRKNYSHETQTIHL